MKLKKGDTQSPIFLRIELVGAIIVVLVVAGILVVASTGIGTTAISSLLSARNQPNTQQQPITLNQNQPITIINEAQPTAVPPTQLPTAVPPTPQPTATPAPTATPMQELAQILAVVQTIEARPSITPAPTATPVTAELIKLQNQITAIENNQPSMALPYVISALSIMLFFASVAIMMLARNRLPQSVFVHPPPPTAVPVPASSPTAVTPNYPTLPDNYLILRRRNRTDDIEKLVSLIRRHRNDERLYYNGRITKRRIAKILSPYLFEDGEQREYAGSFTSIVDEAYSSYFDSLQGATTATTR